MGKLKAVMIRELILRGYSTRTQKAYLGHVSRFARHFMKSPAELGEAEIRQDLQEVDAERRLIHVRGAKRNKDRYTILSDTALDYLRYY